IMAKYTLLHDKNPEQAVRWFKQAASEGDVNSQLFMAASYLYGVGVKKNVDTASRYYIDAAKSGNAIAQFAVADNFLNSRHATNTKLGLIWLSKSAKNGNPKAETKLGTLYLSGKWVAKDSARGMQLINQAVAQNYLPAMLTLGDIALEQNNTTQALQWYNKAANQHNAEAYLKLAHAYLQEKSPIYDPKTGFLWTLKAAQDGLGSAKKDLALLYQKGIGVEADQNLAQEWMAQAVQDEKKQVQNVALAQAALWLSNDKTSRLEETTYQMQGIFSAWQNPLVLKDNSYNQAPQLETLTRNDIFKPQFELTQPNAIPLNNYYDAMISSKVDFPANQWAYPNYPFNSQIESLEKLNSMVVAKSDLPAPYMDANYYDDITSNSDLGLMDAWAQGWQKQANYTSVFNQMYFRAILGDAQSQFQIGQMFQYGIGVAQNDQSAIVFYQNAAEQQHLGAAYNLGILYLQHAKDENDYQTALNWLTDAAFKGNKKAQYVLSRLLNQGKIGSDGRQYIQPNPEQAKSMLYLSAANNYGPAQYELAEYLAREQNSGLNIEVKNHKIALVRQLYAGAAASGVAQALLPLAFYNALDSNPQKQAQAFSVAEEQANNGDEQAALLLGMLYDRGIGAGADPAKAIYWYEKSGENPVSQFILGTYTAEGKGVATNKDKGLSQLQRSAQRQFPFADFNLAVLKHQDNQSFLPELIKAYNLGNSHAGIVLADYYLTENAQNKDVEQLNQAKKIYTGLAEKGDQYAQVKLAYML
ncbi:MAG: endopeptidase IV, partial [bacterium]|nr:endopeptidase IV [bacterium]